MNWERVYAVLGWYDGIIHCVADVRGSAHICEAEFDTNADEYTKFFFVSPIKADLLAFVLEDYALFLRWQAAYKRGEVRIERDQISTVLTEDLPRSHALRALITDRDRVDLSCAKKLRAEFADLANDTKVRWHEV
jgi:hypothetical protein